MRRPSLRPVCTCCGMKPPGTFRKTVGFSSTVCTASAATVTGASASDATSSTFTNRPGRHTRCGLVSVTRAVAVRVCAPMSEPTYDTVPLAVCSNALERMVTGSPMRTRFRLLAATLISAHTVERSEMVNTLTASPTDSPSEMCFSTTMPSKGARSS
jgi:hypothetical protein